MNRVDPNLLLAVSTLVATALLVMTTTVFEPAEPWWRYGLTAVVVIIAFVALQPLSHKLLKTPAGPLIRREAPQSAIWASIYPGLIILMAALPLLFPGVGFGLAVVIAGVFAGTTIRSAMASRADGG